MSTKKTSGISRGFIVGVITVAAVALIVGLIIRFMYPVSADTYQYSDLLDGTFTTSSCEADELWGGTTGTSYYKKIEGTSISSGTQGVSETYDVIGSDLASFFVAPLRMKLTLVNDSKKVKNIFRVGDKIKLSISLQNGTVANYVNKTDVYVHFYDTSTGNLLDNGKVGATITPQVIKMGKKGSWGETKEYLIPQNVTGDLGVRLVYYNYDMRSNRRCGPALDMWKIDMGTGEAEDPHGTESPTVSPSPTVSASATAENKTQITVKPGFNAYSIPSNVKVLDTAALKSAGMKVFAFNLRGQKNWNTAVDTKRILHRIGYYIYNPDTIVKTIEVGRHATQAEDTVVTVHKGWNLFANEKRGVDLALSEIQVKIACSPGASGCDNGFQTVKLSDLFIGNYDTQKAYPIIFTIDDPYASDPDVAFGELKITDTNRTTAKIPARKLYWVYLWPN